MDIKEILESEEFKKELEIAISYGQGEDWQWDEDGDEYRVDTFNLQYATEMALELLKNKLIKS